MSRPQDPAQRSPLDLPDPVPDPVPPVNPYDVPGAPKSPDPVEEPWPATKKFFDDLERDLPTPPVPETVDNDETPVVPSHRTTPKRKK